MQRIIRTPDQRVRVFVSSTLGELADERSAAKEAIQHMHLTPVMFETGARAHPPRDLYRVFLGIYWQRYGWIAPGETMSGLEDEYVLSRRMPKLIYVKRAATREARRVLGNPLPVEPDSIDYAAVLQAATDSPPQVA